MLSIDEGFPRDEIYGLTSQLRRAALSIPCERRGRTLPAQTKVYARHVATALGSHGELETCIELGHRLGYLGDDQKADVDTHIGTVGRLLSALYNAVELKIRRDADSTP